jgi:hypothetical protein
MKPIKTLLVLALLCLPAVASAQRYNRGPAPARGFHNRAGHLTFGGSLGVGFMHDNGRAISCRGCDFKPYAGEGDLHIGGMLSHRFGLMLELQANLQTVQSDFFDGDTTLIQSAAMIAGQFWILPQLWIKGGLGFASLDRDSAYFTEELGSGIALLLAGGVELFSARNFALELQARIIQGTYNSTDDNVTSGTIGVGLNWY